MEALKEGTPAPDFTLNSGPDQKVKLSSFRGRPVILAFYPADWSPVCSDQMSVYQTVLSEFERFNAQLFGVSVDGVWCHQAFAKERKLKFPLLSDFEPKGAMARSFGAYQEKEGICSRALFVIDEKGVIRWSYVSPILVNPGAYGIRAALESMHGGIPS
jgi:peroxiredoxin